MFRDYMVKGGEHTAMTQRYTVGRMTVSTRIERD